MPGRYKIRAVLTWWDEDYNEYSYQLAPSYFWMRKPYSRTTLTVSDKTPHFDEIVRFRSTSKDERPAGYFGTPYAQVLLQVRTSSGWRNVKGSRTYANEWGVAVWRYRWNIRATQRIRAYTVRDSYQPSRSAVLTIDTTRNGRVSSRSAVGVEPFN